MTSDRGFVVSPLGEHHAPILSTHQDGNPMDAPTLDTLHALMIPAIVVILVLAVAVGVHASWKD